MTKFDLDHLARLSPGRAVAKLSTPAEPLAKGLWDSDIRTGGALVHHLMNIALDLVHIDHANFGRSRPNSRNRRSPLLL
jgi:hypothetical protein